MELFLLDTWYSQAPQPLFRSPNVSHSQHQWS